MNVIREVKGNPEAKVDLEGETYRASLVRAPAGRIHLPARSITSVTVPGRGKKRGQPGQESEYIIEPLREQVNSKFLVAQTVVVGEGPWTIPIVNMGEEDIVLAGKTPLGIVNQVSHVVVSEVGFKEGKEQIVVQCNRVEEGKRRVICYASRTLRPTEKNMDNYSSMKLELLALKWAVTEKFRGYLIGAKSVIYTDNNPLSYLKTSKLGAVEQRWAAQLAIFDFDIKYRSGKSNVNADMPSRYPLQVSGEDQEEELVAAMAVTATPIPPAVARREEQAVAYVQCTSAQQRTSDSADVDSDEEERDVEGRVDPGKAQQTLHSYDPKELQKFQEEDPVIQPVLEAWRNQRLPPGPEMRGHGAACATLFRQWDRLCLEQNLLYRKKQDSATRQTCFQLVLPEKLRRLAFEAVHATGHQGADRCLRLLQKRCYWLGMYAMLGQEVLIREHHTGRSKIQDAWKTEIFRVIGTPNQDGAPYMVESKVTGAKRRVHRAELKVYHGPSYNDNAPALQLPLLRRQRPRESSDSDDSENEEVWLTRRSRRANAGVHSNPYRLPQEARH
ncbi:hypothetical protein ACOMHN_061674 [Nucella lapillus]